MSVLNTVIISLSTKASLVNQQSHGHRIVNHHILDQMGRLFVVVKADDLKGKGMPMESTRKETKEQKMSLRSFLGFVGVEWYQSKRKGRKIVSAR